MGRWQSRLENMEITALKNIFNGRKVFLTGHTGFKGSWLLSVLHTLGADIKGYALPPADEKDIYHSINGNVLCQSVIADIRDAEKLRSEILGFKPDFIFHLAAQPLVRLSYESPLDTYAINSQGTANVLDAMRFLDKACVSVMITTDKVYANLETGHYYSENDRLGGYDPYSASKACAELVIDSYRNSFFNPARYDQHKKSISVARAGNVIGGGDWSRDRIIPDIVRALSAGESVKVRNPASVRPWQHVLEPVLGYVVLAAQQFNGPLQYATAFNFGPSANDILPVSQLVEMAIENWGGGTFEKPANIDQPHEAGLLHLDIAKAAKELGWQPKMNSTAAIKNTIDWYKTALTDKTNIKQYTEQQINNYLKLYNER